MLIVAIIDITMRVVVLTESPRQSICAAGCVRRCLPEQQRSLALDGHDHRRW
jgi:hypothetical protein